MAVYKVPQDVEAEDKLVGPLSFRQFIYLMIAGASAFVGFMLFQASPFLVIIALPFVLLFGALALPLRKDQPMETYLLAMLRFFLKPKRRLWDPDGTITYVEITAPKTVERHLTKELTEQAAEERLDYLSRVMDSRGWALKGIDKADASLTPNVAAEAAEATDVLDDQAQLARSFDDLIAKKNEQHRQEAVQKMQAAQAVPTPAKPKFANNPYDDVLNEEEPPAEPAVHPHYNPYPSIHQRVINPNGPTADDTTTDDATTADDHKQIKNKSPKAVTDPLSPDIMRLASNNDLSISAIAREAHRLEEGDEGEVVITLH
jgi:hypothetical protein